MFDAFPLERLALTLLHFVWQGVVIALAAWALMTLVRRPTIRYGIGCAGLVAMVTFPLVTYARLSPPQVAIVAPAQHAATPALALTQPMRTQKRDVPAPMRDRPASKRVQEALTTASPWIVSGWLAGVGLMTVRNAVGVVAVARLRRRTTLLVHPELRARVARVANRMHIRRPIALLGAAAIESPCVVGWLRPAILWPACAMSGLTPLQLDALLAHELAHIRRHDYLVNLLQACVEAIGFYHPAVWWLSRRVRQEREHCCDDIAAEVIGDRVRYAEALAAVESLRQEPTFSVAARGGSLTNRIRRLLAVPTPRRVPVIGRFGTMLLLGVVLIASVQLLRGDRVAPATQPTAVAPRLRELAQDDRMIAQLLARRDRLMTPLRADKQPRPPLMPDTTSVRDERVKALDRQLDQRASQVERGAADAEAATDVADGIYYMGGHVVRTGAYSLGGRQITLLQAIVAAGEMDNAVLRDADGEIWIDVIERDKPNATPSEWIGRFAWSDVKAGRHDDFMLLADDQIRVGVNVSPATTQPTDVAPVTVPTTQPAAERSTIDAAAVAPGDLLEIRISDLAGPGTETLQSRAVMADGKILLPYLGTLRVTQLTATEIEAVVRNAYRTAQILPDTTVKVSVVGDAQGGRPPAAQTTLPTSGPAPQTAPATAGDYRITGGDLLRITINELEAGGTTSVLIKRVANSGGINLPYFKMPFMLAGQTEAEARATIMAAYVKAKILSEPIVDVLVVEGSDGKKVPLELLATAGTTAAAPEALQQQIAELTRKLAELSAKVEAATTQKAAVPPLQIDELALAKKEPFFGMLLRQRDALRLDLAKLQMTQGPKSPIVENLENRLAQAEQQIREIAAQLAK